MTPLEEALLAETSRLWEVLITMADEKYLRDVGQSDFDFLQSIIEKRAMTRAQALRIGT